jgi:hypothetical protein
VDRCVVGLLVCKDSFDFCAKFLFILLLFPRYSDSSIRVVHKTSMRLPFSLLQIRSFVSNISHSSSFLLFQPFYPDLIKIFLNIPSFISGVSFITRKCYPKIYHSAQPLEYTHHTALQNSLFLVESQQYIIMNFV